MLSLQLVRIMLQEGGNIHFFLLLQVPCLLACVSGSQVAHVVREGRKLEVQGGIDFSDAKFDEKSGKMCILKNVEVDTLEKEPLLQCTHK